MRFIMEKFNAKSMNSHEDLLARRIQKQDVPPKTGRVVCMGRFSCH